MTRSLGWHPIFRRCSTQGFCLPFTDHQSKKPHTFLLEALNADRNYPRTFQDPRSQGRAVFGSERMKQGLQVTFLTQDSSELIFFDELLNWRYPEKVY